MTLSRLRAKDLLRVWVGQKLPRLVNGRSDEGERCVDWNYLREEQKAFMYIVACGQCSLTLSADDVQQRSVQLPCSQHL
jgi:hypothetical protein